MPKITAVVKEDLGLGFALAGVGYRSCSTSDEALSMIQTLMADRDQAIVIVEEDLLDGVEAHVRADLLKRTVPLIVPVPGSMEWKDTEETHRDDVVARLIRQAVGYQLNIQV